MMNKRAELTTTQIITLIILVTSFAIILFFIIRLNLGGTTEQEICRNSVVLKGNSILPSETVSLNCRTRLTCLSTSKNCDKFVNPDEVLKVKDKEEVYSALAETMVGCWFQFGEGKIDYLGEGDLVSNQYCAICNQIGFDESLYEENGIFSDGELNQEEFYQYLIDTDMPGKKRTYAEYFFNQEIAKGSTFEQNFKQIDVEKIQLIVTGINSVSTWEYVVGGVLVVGATILTVVTFGVGVPVLIGAVAITVGGTGGHFLGTVVQGASGDDFLLPTIVEAATDEFTALNCEDIETLG